MRMMMSVLMFGRSSGAAMPSSTVNASIMSMLLPGVAGQSSTPFCPQIVRTSTMCPASAAAAAMAGLARWVRAPGPWRPTKLRLEVETLR